MTIPIIYIYNEKFKFTQQFSLELVSNDREIENKQNCNNFIQFVTTNLVLINIISCDNGEELQQKWKYMQNR